MIIRDLILVVIKIKVNIRSINSQTVFLAKNCKLPLNQKNVIVGQGNKVKTLEVIGIHKIGNQTLI